MKPKTLVATMIGITLALAGFGCLYLSTHPNPFFQSTQRTPFSPLHGFWRPVKGYVHFITEYNSDGNLYGHYRQELILDLPYYIDGKTLFVKPMAMAGEHGSPTPITWSVSNDDKILTLTHQDGSVIEYERVNNAQDFGEERPLP